MFSSDFRATTAESFFTTNQNDWDTDGKRPLQKGAREAETLTWSGIGQQARERLIKLQVSTPEAAKHGAGQSDPWTQEWNANVVKGAVLKKRLEANQVGSQLANALTYIEVLLRPRSCEKTAWLRDWGVPEVHWATFELTFILKWGSLVSE